MKKQARVLYNESVKMLAVQGFSAEEAKDILCNKCGNFGFECQCAWGPSMIDKHEREDILK